MEENPNQNQNSPLDQAIRRMNIREYYDTSESQTYTSISAPPAYNVSFRINPYMFQLLPTF